MSAIHLIAAQTENRIIGKNGGMPWHLPADLAHFKRLTTGCPIIMGRATYQSLGRALPNRDNRIISRTGFAASDAQTHPSLEDALASIKAAPIIYIIGGGQLYRTALPLAQQLDITWIHTSIDGDTVFPEIDPACWQETCREYHPADPQNPYPLSFTTYRRR